MKRTRGSASNKGLVIVMVCILAASAAFAGRARELTFDERVKAQQAIEQVYWNHRIWPKENPGRKPPLSAVMPDAAIRAEVTSYLASSGALAKESGFPISERQLRDEQNRMIAHTRAPGVLEELFAALGNDPVLIGETLVRQKLVDRRGASGAPSAMSSVGCAVESWTPTSTGAGVPAARGYPMAVWTGSEMIVWGGLSNGTFLGSGGRYDPATDSWAPVSAVGAPDARLEATAIWTGTEMIVWGGRNASGTVLDTGARYNPATDTWRPTTMAAAPHVRNSHTAVWTGSKMIVWGGRYTDVYFDAFYLDSGGLYDPVNDTWSPTSIGSNVPSARDSHTAVWTGTEMIVWGGIVGSSRQTTGGRYDPVSDTWTPVGTNGAPSGRTGNTAIWSGTRMIVWGGEASDGLSEGTGDRYDPMTDGWFPTSMTNAPAPRAFHTAVWTGTEMIVWGGGHPGGRYDPVRDTWVATAVSGAPEGRTSHAAVWTGTHMVVWGGFGSGASAELDTGGIYCPGCDDGNPCTIDSYDSAAGCTHTPTPGSACDDGNACTAGEFCSVDLVCAGSVPVLCDDGNICTTDGCNPATGCTHLNNTAPCDSGDACIVSVCSAGSCVPGPPRNCDDANVCTADSCDPSIGCVHTATNDGGSCNDGSVCTTSDSCRSGVCRGDPMSDGTPCEDFNACTTSSTCLGGSCVGGPPPNCDDGNACTDDRCDPAIGCRHVNNFHSCDDHNACTGNDHCQGAGTCGGTSPIHCPLEPGFGGSVCTGFQRCDPVLFCVMVTQPIICDDHNVCTTDSCDPNMPYMGCRYDPISCDDHNACTADSCDRVAGCGHAPISCDDQNPCTADACDRSAGCVHTPVNEGASCSDGSVCTTNDSCVGGVCIGGLPIHCDDGNPCSVDSCDPVTGCLSTATDPSCEEPKSVNFYRRVCRKETKGETMTDANADCVNDSATFASVDTIDAMCERLYPDPGGDRCEQAEAQFMATLLNRCKGRITDDEPIDSKCSEHTVVSQSIGESDALLSSPSRADEECILADCESTEINSGKAIGPLLTVTRQPEGGVRLEWTASPASDDSRAPTNYAVWRGPLGGPFTRVAEVTALSYVDPPSETGVDRQYEVTAE